MARYVIWDKQTPVVTPIGEALAPAEWLARYPAAGAEGVNYVVGGGVVNGCVMMEYTATLAHYAAQGCDFSNCVTEQEHLDAIEAFEDAPQGPAYTDETRIADALEDLVVLQMPDIEGV